ncbi:hypothetical protein EXIGLDRAFT_717082 [Exidia glandulosa HHB12029]|uniref:F-box domain-containing protein n=1 Tax=Exidia glandulosa HHB12029 TaxID=1314781 RepID=A0A165IJE0_EXIGL|nr:hypothetical protein EXIGLDRAFT_717082 [Exidia glandulosa HHB12029]
MASPTVCPIEATPSSPAVDYHRFLLPELILCVFDYLPHRDLLSAANACALWRCLALKHPDFAYHIALVVDVKHPTFCTRLTNFCAALRCALHRNVNVCVSVDWRPASALVRNNTGALVLQAETVLNADANPERMSRVQAMRTIVAAIGSSLDRIVNLELTFGAVHRQTLFQEVFYKLETPAPHLQEFALKIEMPSKLYDEHRTYLPLSLFARSAPKLWRLTMAGIELNARPLAAFSKVSELDVARVNPAIDMHALFPNLRDLSVRITPFEHVAAALRCVTGKLTRLTTALGPVMSMSLSLSEYMLMIPRTFIILDVSGQMISLLKLAPRIVLRLGRIADPQDPGGYCTVVTIASYDSPVVREFGLRWRTDPELHGILSVNLRVFGPRIVAMYVQDCFLDVLSDFFDTLPELEIITVEWPAIPTSNLRSSLHKRLYCPKLRQVNLIDFASRVEASTNAERLRNAIWPGELEGPLSYMYKGNDHCLRDVTATYRPPTPADISTETMHRAMKATLQRIFGSLAV